MNVSRPARVAIAVSVLAAVLLGVRATQRPNDGDLVVYYRTCGRVLDGLDLYHHREGLDPEQPTAYIYPPPFALFFAPLTRLPFDLLRGLWCAFSVLAAARAAWIAVRLLPRAPPPAAVVLGVLFWLRYAWGDLNHGQVNLLVAWLTLEGVGAVEDGREGWGGAWLAGAVVLKVTPAIVIAYYLFQRRWRVLQAAALCGLALLLAPGFVVGHALNADYLRRFVTEVTPWNARFHAFVGNNAALPGALARWLAGSADAGQATRPLLGATPLLSPAAALGVGRGLSACMLCATLILARRASRVRALALVLAAVPLISPIAWKPHLVVLILPGAVAGAALLRPGRHRLPLGFALFAVGLAGRGLVGTSAANAWMLYGGTSLGLLALWAGLAVAPEEALDRTADDHETPATRQSDSPVAPEVQS